MYVLKSHAHLRWKNTIFPQVFHVNFQLLRMILWCFRLHQVIIENEKEITEKDTIVNLVKIKKSVP